LNSIIERDVSFDHDLTLDLDDDLGCFTHPGGDWMIRQSPGRSVYPAPGGGVDDDIERGIGGGIQRSTIDCFDFCLLQSHRTAIRAVPLNASAAEAVRSCLRERPVDLSSRTPDRIGIDALSLEGYSPETVAHQPTSD